MYDFKFDAKESADTAFSDLQTLSEEDTQVMRVNALVLRVDPTILTREVLDKMQDNMVAAAI